MPKSAAADRHVTGVVELFTSQGCSSCPPADRILAELSREDGVLALAWHVDYWDYIGWKDTLALPESTARQRAYALQFNATSVYTPQAVVNGAAGFIGSHEAELRSALSATPLALTGLEITRSPRSITVGLPAIAAPAGDMLVELIYFEPETAVEITRGENAGKTAQYHNAVRGMTVLGLWSGEARRIEMPLSEMDAHAAKGCAVIIRALDGEGRPHRILGAALLP